jgi:hypothetical protein
MAKSTRKHSLSGKDETTGPIGDRGLPSKEEEIMRSGWGLCLSKSW